jgi:hypothetical protein
MALSAGSPAIDAGVLGNCQATDQRGVAATDGNGDLVVVCDSGAFEAPAYVAVTAIPAVSITGLVLLAAFLALVGIEISRRRSLGRSPGPRRASD